MKQIYKNLFYDEEERGYFFMDENDTKQIVSQESYLLIYILEVMMRNETPTLSN